MSQKKKGILISVLVYLIGAGLGVGLGYLFRGIPIFANFLLCDVIVTIYIWTLGTILKTSMLYRPYWSLQTFCMFAAILIFYDSFSLSTFLVMILIMLWSLRLTLHYVYQFKSFETEGERHRMIKEKTGAFYPIANLFLLHLVPTLVVYLASLPIYNYAFNNVASSTSALFNPFDIIGEALMLSGILLEGMADYQMIQFQKDESNQGKTCQSGLWKYSRHPNYLGEILFFLGIFLVYMLDILDVHFLYWLASPVAIVLYYIIAAILEEKGLKKTHEDYESYQKKTSFLLLLPARK